MFTALGVAALATWLRTGDDGLLPAAGLFLAAAALTKNEGETFALTALVAALLVARRTQVRPLLLPAGAVLLADLPWRLWLQLNHVRIAEYSLSNLADPATSRDHSDRVRPAAAELWTQLWSVGSWSYLVRLILFALAAALVLRRFRPALFGVGWLLLSFAGLVAIYWISTNPLESHLANSSDRTIDSLVLAAGLLVPVLLYDERRSERPARDVAPARRADGDERHPVGSRDGTARRLRVEADERAHLDRHLVAVDAPEARPANDDRYLFLAALALVVLVPRSQRRQLEEVDPERLDAEDAADEADIPAGPGALEFGDIDHRVPHCRRPLYPYPAAVIRGAFAAALTPLRDGGAALDEEVFGPYVGFLHDGGVDGILAIGTTGEGMLLGVGERRRAAELFIEAARGRLDVAVHAGPSRRRTRWRSPLTRRRRAPPGSR